MNQDNGGIIGKINTPTTSVASGVWSLQDQFESQSSSIWPLGFPQTTFTNSCRFNDDSSDYLNRTPSSASNRKTFTFSVWVKRSEIGTATSQRNCIFSAGTANENKTEIMFSGDQFQFVEKQSDSVTLNLETNRLFRDVSAWYHLVVAVDTTQSTSSDRIKMYVNSTQISDFASSTYPSQDHTAYINDDRAHHIGRRGYSDYYSFDGYMTEIILVDGQQLTPTSFGATNPVTNIWEPIAYAGTYGTNGFKLNFSDSSALGDDTSGNGNDFTVNNLTSIDQVSDTPSNNFCLLNPLDFTGSITASEGNTVFQGGRYKGTFGVSSGKWYWEAKRLNAPDEAYIGIKADDGDWNNSFGNSYTVYTSNGKYYLNGSDQGSYGSSSTTNDILMFALDMDNGKFYVGENGTFYNSGDPAAGSNPMASSISGTYLPAVINNSASGTDQYSFNFGNSSFSISSGNADANGFGNFEYAVPSGYFALCTKNLAEHG
mgnify:CR=1 FL=1|jgi:hypothetical protein